MALLCACMYSSVPSVLVWVPLLSHAIRRCAMHNISCVCCTHRRHAVQCSPLVGPSLSSCLLRGVMFLRPSGLLVEPTSAHAT
jgi:hypothetical protein